MVDYSAGFTSVAMQWQFEQFGYSPQRGVSQDRVIINPADYVHFFIFQSTAEVIQGASTLFRDQFIGKNSPYLDSFLLKQGQPHINVINNISQSSACHHQQRRIQHPRDFSIGCF